MAAAEERPREVEGEAKKADVVYRTKVVQFLGRSTPIILQNDNGPCPLLAICNVLLLRNNLDLSVDVSEVSQAKLLDLVAGRLIDSNSNLQGKDDGYVSNQQQNLSDAINLLPNLATGIDVNVHFRKINDFEFTPECAIFDLLDIGLYHGWIVDPQDTDTAQVIGSKSYNMLVAELVAFEARKSEEADERTPEEDCIDFAAATTATLGVPSPTLSRGRSFDDAPVSAPSDEGGRRGDREEAEELMRILNLSRTEVHSTVNVPMSHAEWSNSSLISREGTHIISPGSPTHTDSVAQKEESEKSPQSNLLESPECNPSSDHQVDAIYLEGQGTRNDKTIPITVENNSGNSVSEGSGDVLASCYPAEKVGVDVSMQNQISAVTSSELDRSECHCSEDQITVSREGRSEEQSSSENFPSQVHHMLVDNQKEHDLAVFSSPVAPCADLHSSNRTKELLDVSEEVTSSFAGSEPIYEGEECILDSGLPRYEDQEPVYEGEAVLAEQADKADEDAAPLHSKDKVSQRQWQLIKNFLENSASQLTIYGLFCLQEDLKERELSVFFRNNHFGTLFKFNGELYLLATDQGYINQPDLVWEKLNEVNGDTVFMTGDFKEFKVDAQVNDAWNEQNAMTSTAEYLAALEGSAPTTSTFNSDLQLAIALQQQEFEQQPQRQQQQSSQQAPANGRPRLSTGPQVSRSSTASQKYESKSKDKCTVM